MRPASVAVPPRIAPAPARSLLALFPPFSPESVGGIQVSGRAAWQALSAEARHRGGPPPVLFSGREAADGQPVVGFSRTGAVLRAVTGGWSADVVLVWHLRLIRLLPLLRLPRARVVVFLHGIEAWQRLSPLTRQGMRRVSLFLSNSDHTWRRSLSFHPDWQDRPQATVHLGLGGPVGPAPGRPDPEPTALMLGRLATSEDYKGHRETIAAWPHVVARVPGARLWIAGDGDLRSAIAALAAASPARDHIRVMGLVSEEEKQRLLVRSRCLVLPSRAEGFGLVYLEAMRLGRPCLVSTLDAGREVVAPPTAGLAADPADLPALTDAAARLLTPGAAWDERSAQARRRYEERFTARHFGARLVEALGRVPAAPGAGDRVGAGRGR